jgi:hypothetical protein
MTALDVFAFVVMAVLLGVGVWLALLLGALPGRIAAKREHPQSDAIRVAGWIGLVTLGVVWPFALIWAYTRPAGASNDPGSDSGEAVRRLADRVAALESNHVSDGDARSVDSRSYS